MDVYFEYSRVFRKNVAIFFLLEQNLSNHYEIPLILTESTQNQEISEIFFGKMSMQIYEKGALV